MQLRRVGVQISMRFFVVPRTNNRTFSLFLLLAKIPKSENILTSNINNGVKHTQNMTDKIPKEEDKQEIEISQTEKNIQTVSQSKPRALKWDGTINFGNILTIFTIILATVALLYQKKLVDTKVKDLQVVVDSLEQEKFVRELSILEHESKIINGDTYNLDYTVTQLRVVQKTYNQQFIETLTQLNNIFTLIESQNQLDPVELANLKKAKLINEARREIFIHDLMFYQKTEDFSLRYEPKRENFYNDQDYISAVNKYTDTLRKNNNYLLGILDSLLETPKKRIEELTDKH